MISVVSLVALLCLSTLSRCLLVAFKISPIPQDLWLNRGHCRDHTIKTIHPKKIDSSNFMLLASRFGTLALVLLLHWLPNPICIPIVMQPIVQFTPFCSIFMLASSAAWMSLEGKYRLWNKLDDAEAQICCYGMQANVLGVVSQQEQGMQRMRQLKESIAMSSINVPWPVRLVWQKHFFLEGWEDLRFFGRFFDLKELLRVLNICCRGATSSL